MSDPAAPALLMVTTVPVTLSAFLLPYVRHYRARGWRVEAAAAGLSSWPELAAELDACHDLPLAREPRRWGRLPGAPAAIRALVARGRYDLVHVHTPVAAFLVRYALRRDRPRPRIVYTAHGFHFHRGGARLANALFRSLERTAAGWCDALVTINREDQRAALAAGFPTRIEYMPGIGIDTRAWSPERVPAAAVQAVRRELGLGEGDALFLQVAELNPGKRHVDAVRALAALGDGRAHLAFAGAGRTGPQVRRLARDLGVAARVYLLGHRHDIPALIRASRAVLLPSVREGLPRSLLESMSLAVPIIVADTRGCRDLAAGGCGRVHPARDPAALAAAMGLLLADPGEARAMGERCREAVQAYDLEHLLALHDRLYAELLGPGSG